MSLSQFASPCLPPGPTYGARSSGYNPVTHAPVACFMEPRSRQSAATEKRQGRKRARGPSRSKPELAGRVVRTVGAWSEVLLAGALAGASGGRGQIVYRHDNTGKISKTKPPAFALSEKRRASHIVAHKQTKVRQCVVPCAHAPQAHSAKCGMWLRSNTSDPLRTSTNRPAPHAPNWHPHAPHFPTTDGPDGLVALAGWRASVA